MLLRAAGRRHAAAICALRRVAVDNKLKSKCATAIAKVRAMGQEGGRAANG